VKWTQERLGGRKGVGLRMDRGGQRKQLQIIKNGDKGKAVVGDVQRKTPERVTSVWGERGRRKPKKPIWHRKKGCIREVNKGGSD